MKDKYPTIFPYPIGYRFSLGLIMDRRYDKITVEFTQKYGELEKVMQPSENKNFMNLLSVPGVTYVPPVTALYTS